MNNNIVRQIVDVFFPSHGVSVECSDGIRYPAEPKLAKSIRSLNVTDLSQLIGAGAELASDGEQLVVVALHRPQAVQGQDAPSSSPDFITGATQLQQTPKKVIVDAYGVAVDVDRHGEMWVYPCNRFGAPDPVGTKVTTKDAAFLAAARAAIVDAVLA